MTTALDQGLRDRDLKLVFGGASFVPEDLSSVAYAVEATYASGDWGTTRTVILASEVDIADNGRYLLRFRLWPFHTFALAFHTLSLSEEPATPDDGRPGSFTFTNEDDD